MCLAATYQFNQAVVRVEVSVDDAHGMKVSLERGRKLSQTHHRPHLMFLQEVPLYSLI